MEEEIPEVVKQLIDMEFDKNDAMNAYNNCDSKHDLSMLIEWIQDDQQKQQKKLTNEVSQCQEAVSLAEQARDEAAQALLQAELQQKKPISDLVDPVLSKQLQEMGNTKIVAEKALFMTLKYKSINAAQDWIDDHCYDEDFNEELFIVGEQEPKKQMSKEEAKAYTQQKLIEIRARKAAEEAAYKKESEINRIKSTKTMGDTAQILKDAERQRDQLMAKRQREQDEKDKQEMLEILRQDKEQKFGKKFASGGVKIVEEKKEKPLIERFELSVKSIAVAHPKNLYEDKAKICLQTIITFTENIIKNPTEEKFKKINLSNKAVQSRIAECFAGIATLELIGFVNDSQFLTLPNVILSFQPPHPPQTQRFQNFDLNFLKQCIAIVQKELNSI